MASVVRNQSPELGSTPSVTYNRLFLQQDPIFSSEGVPILRVVSGSLCSRFHKNQPVLPFFFRVCRILALLLFCGSSLIAWAQQDVVQQIRVIGNRRIPRETVLARLFTHVGDTYDPATVERDFNSLWNTGYFENLQIAREDTPKGVVLDVIVKEKPTIREINYKGLNSVSTSDVLDRFKKEHVSLSVESPYDPTRLARAIDVIRALLAEHGHQFATVKPDIKTIPPASVSINFIIKEGPTVKVGNITFTGNRAVSSRELRAAMKNLRPVGIPHSIFLENIFARTYDASKLEEDTERVRRALQDRGYFKATVDTPTTHIRNEGGLSFFTFRPRTGKRIDIRLPIDEGERYRLGGVTFTGNTAVKNGKALRAQFPTKDGEWFNATAVGKGLENLRKAYGSLGFINMTGVPNTRFDEAKHEVFLDIDIDEGKPFTVSRIEFQGNTITRDRVIRRELLIEEGQPYNSNQWESSLLRLNQLDYFDPLKVDTDSDIHPDESTGTVSLLLRVHEKGKNSIGLNGGVSGLSGTFLGLNYSTNNFLGLGETLSLQGNIGNLSRNVVFAFTEPYLRNKPMSLGFQLFSRKTDYNSARNFASVTGQASNLTTAQQSLVQNYNQSSTGLNFSISYPIPRTFKRVGLTYSWDKSTITTFSQASANLFQTLAFRSGQIQGANALEGIYTSSVSLSYVYNRVGPSIFKPRFGTDISAAFQLAGLFGNVRYFSPVVQYKHFVGMKGLHPNPEGRNVLGYRMQASYIQGYSGDVAPPFARFYSGGDNELRGFDVRAATPYAFIPVRTNITLTNPDGTPVPIDPTNFTLGFIPIPIPIYRPVSVGGDVKFTSNVEYRIPIAGPVSFALFDDFDITSVVRQSQLRQSVEGADQLNSPLYGCTSYYNGACQGGQSIQFINLIRPISGTNVVPRMSVGGELQAFLPIVNAPFRLYYAFNTLRLFENVQGESLITRSMFPAGGAGDFTYQNAITAFDSLLHFREPRKTFRLSVSTTF
jgi:outer membrane protein insertion porin family